MDHMPNHRLHNLLHPPFHDRRPDHVLSRKTLSRLYDPDFVDNWFLCRVHPWFVIDDSMRTLQTRLNNTVLVRIGRSSSNVHLCAPRFLMPQAYWHVLNMSNLRLHYFLNWNGAFDYASFCDFLLELDSLNLRCFYHSPLMWSLLVSIMHFGRDFCHLPC